MKLFRHSILPISYLENLKDFTDKKEYAIIDGVRVKITSQRYGVFKKNTKCVVCGLEGSFLAIEKDNRMKPKPSKNFHINMYGIDENGCEVLMTKDHIVPKSKGGDNNGDNYQTMCTRCNSKKRDIFHNKTKIYLDLDGLFCNFMGRFEQILRDKGEEIMSFEEHGQKYGWVVTWKLIEDEGVKFWKNLKWLDGSKQLWSHLKSYQNKEILTGCPFGKAEEYAIEGKTHWVKNNLGNIKTNFTQGRFKYKFITDGEILIDDSKRNCDLWEQAGGKAILHTGDYSETISKLKELIKNE